MATYYYKITAVNELGESVETTGSFETAEPVAGAHASTHASGGSDPLTGSLDANARVAVRKNSTGTAVGTRRRLNFIEGTNVSLTVADDSGGEEVDITVAGAQAGAVADVATADATDLASAQALANANKAKINQLLASLRASGLLAT
jgi:hypothetical protein